MQYNVAQWTGVRVGAVTTNELPLGGCVAVWYKQ